MYGRIPTVQEIRARYEPKAEAEAKETWLLYRVIRPVSFYLTVPFLALGVSSNQVSFGGLAVGLLATCLFATGNHRLAIIGSGLFILATFADYVDGNIARYYGRTSHYGKFVDAFAENTLAALLPIGLALGLSRRPDQLMASLPDLASSSVVWTMAALWSVLIALTLQFTFRIRAAKLQIRLQPVFKDMANHNAGTPPSIDMKGDATSGMPPWLGHTLRRTYRTLRAEQSMMQFMLPIFIWLDVASLFIGLRCAASVLWFVLVSGSLLDDASNNLRIRRMQV